jgi:hypothetical protein
MDGSRKQAALTRLRRATAHAHTCATRVQTAATPLAKAEALSAVIEANEILQDAALVYLQSLDEFLGGREHSA